MNKASEEEGIQITGLEILTDDNNNSNNNGQTKKTAPPASKKAKGLLSPKPAPAFIRGGKKKINRTHSLPRSFQRPVANTNAVMVPPAAKNVHLSPVRRPKPKLTLRAGQQTQPPQLMTGRRRSSMGGGAALARVSRRVSIGNEAVGVTQTTWGQRPQRRRSSAGGDGNYRWASQTPNTNNTGAAEDDSQASDFSDYMLDEDEDAKQKNRRPQVSVNVSAVHVNQRSMNNTSCNDDVSVMTDYSYANDSLDLRPKIKTTKEGKAKKKKKTRGSNLDRFMERNKKQQGQIDNEDEEESYDDTYANDSLDLRKKKYSDKRRDRLQEEKEVEDYSDDDADTAADSLDLRNKKYSNKQRDRLHEEVEDYSEDDADTAVDSLDLRKYNKKKTARQEVDEYLEDDDDDDDADTAVDSLDLRKYNQKRIARQQAEDNYYDDDSDADTAVDSVDLRKHKQTKLGKEEDCLDDDHDDDTAVDSLDLRKYKQKKLAKEGQDEEFDDFDDADTAVDSLDLRRNARMKMEREGAAAADDYEDDDDFDDADTAVDSLDLRRNAQMKIKEDESQSHSGRCLDDSAASSAFSYAVDSVDFRNFRKQKSSQQKARAMEAATTAVVTAEDLGYGDATPTREDLGYGDEQVSESQNDDSNNVTPGLGYADEAPSKAELGYEEEPMLNPSFDEDSSYDVQSYAVDSVDLRLKRVKPGVSSRTATTTEDEFDSDEDEDDSDESDDEDADSTKTPMDYMTRIVLGYQKKKKPATNKDQGEGAERRMSNDTAASDAYSYACDSVAMKEQKNRALPGIGLGRFARKEGYGDDECSDDSSDDDSQYGKNRPNNPYLSGMLGHSKPKLQASASFDTGMERRLSCNSYANDSVHMRRHKEETEKPGRRESIDSFASGVSGTGIDPDYLNRVLGYALETPAATASSTAKKSTVLAPPRPRDCRESPGDVLVNTAGMWDSFTSIDSGENWALSPTPTAQPKVSMSTAKALQHTMDSIGGLDTDKSQSENLGSL